MENVNELINKHLSVLTGQECDELKRDIGKVQTYMNLKDYDEKENSNNSAEIKEKFIQKFSAKCHKDFRYVKNVVVMKSFCFGNQMIALNNIIYYCEMLGIKNLYLNSQYDFYIKNDIITDKIHISVKSNDSFNCMDKDTFCGQLIGDFYYPEYVRPKRRALILKDEIIKNLPQVQLNKDDLYIYIRAGDLFNPNINGYTPAPYCFYERVITKFKFNDIYIISVDDKNPVIGKLISNFPNIKHKFNDVKLDIATLVKAYNLANSVSSFSQVSISFNDNLENLFEYEIYKTYAAILHFHYDIDKLNKKFNIYRMKPSENYFRRMYKWENTEEQRKLLLDENCPNDFIKTKN